MRENMFRLRFSTDCHPRTKKGQPPHSTTGVARANSSHCSGCGAMNLATPPGASSAVMARMKSGSASAAPTRKRRDMSASSAFSSDAAGVRDSSAMPQIGQLPGSLRTICGCMGQVYSTAAGAAGSSGSNDMPHFGQVPGPAWRTSGCIGQV
jgi:hypothetical protein